MILQHNEYNEVPSIKYIICSGVECDAQLPFQILNENGLLILNPNLHKWEQKDGMFFCKNCSLNLTYTRPSIDLIQLKKPIIGTVSGMMYANTGTILKVIREYPTYFKCVKWHRFKGTLDKLHIPVFKNSKNYKKYEPNNSK